MTNNNNKRNLHKSFLCAVISVTCLWLTGIFFVYIDTAWCKENLYTDIVTKAQKQTVDYSHIHRQKLSLADLVKPARKVLFFKLYND